MAEGGVTSRQEEVEKKVQEWLNQVGWKRNPFARPHTLIEPITRAEDEDALEQYFVAAAIQFGWPSQPTENDSEDDRRDFDRLLDKKHSVLFARSGEGKTGSRLMVAELARADGYFVVNYLGLRGETRSVDDHATEIGGLIRSQVSQQRIGAGEIFSQDNQISPIEQLTKLVNAIVSSRCPAIFILVNDLELGTGPETEIDKVEQSIKNLFDLSLLEIRGMFFKFFLPVDLESKLSKYQIFQRRRIDLDIFHIRWTNKLVCQLISNRISQVNQKPLYSNFASLKAEDVGSSLDFDQKIAEVALSKYGTPRNLSLLANELIINVTGHRASKGLTEEYLKESAENFLRGFPPEQDEPMESPNTEKPPSMRSTRHERNDNSAAIVAPHTAISIVLGASVAIVFIVGGVFYVTQSLLLSIGALVIFILVSIVMFVSLMTGERFSRIQSAQIFRKVIDAAGGIWAKLIGSLSDRLHRK